VKTYDFLFAGGGLAGLSLACRLASQEEFAGSKLLIVDPSDKQADDRTFSFWSQEPGEFCSAVSASWDRLAFHTPDFSRRVRLGSYRYHTLRGLDFYTAARTRLASRPNVEFLQGCVTEIEDGPAQARLRVNGEVYAGRWALDSRPATASLPPAPSNGHIEMKLVFHGWEVRAEHDAFDPGTAVLMDFRTPQQGEIRFFYVLPFSPRHALVEYTVFCSGKPDLSACDDALREYLLSTCALEPGLNCQAHPKEGGCLQVTDRPFPRRPSPHVLRIGLSGGRLKPATGYAYTRIQRDSQAVVSSLLEHGDPFHLPEDPPPYPALDAIMLEVFARQPHLIPGVFAALFKNNPTGRILRFLDEEASTGEILQLMASLPASIFVPIALRRGLRV
jgi:lycopene beta-cyclase